MSETWDAIVIGAGVGGLTAAATLVQEGLRVLILEKNPHPGGTAYVYHRKGFSFPMGPLGFSSLESIRQTLGDLGIAENLEFSRVHYRIRAFNLDLPISLPYSELKTLFSASFPSDARGINHFFQSIENQGQEQRSPDCSASEFLKGLVRDERLRCILGSMGAREPYSSLSLLAAMWNLMSYHGIWFPQEGMESFCLRLVKALSPATEIRLGKEVSRIRVDQGRVVGVTLKDGTDMNARSVISNADYKHTFLKLIDPEVLPPDWHKAVSEARQTGSILQVCLGVDAEKSDLSAFEEASRLVYRRARNGFNDPSPNWNAVEIDPEVLAAQELEVSLWGETRLPTGKKGLVIVIRTEAEYHHFKQYRSSSQRRLPGYQEYKTRLGLALIREVERLLPGVRDSILVMDVATPLTFEDQGGRSGGAVAGWSWDYEDFKDNQPKELIRTPIRGLYMAGYQAFSALFMGGVPTAMESGKRAAKAVLQNADPIDEILIPLTPSLSPDGRGEG